MKSVMAHSFAQIPEAEIQRSSFDRSHGYKTTFDSGYLIPIFVDEALPGDTFNLRLNAFARLATPLKPIMDNLFLETFFFAVPYRLVWSNWQKFNGEQANPGDSTDFTIPQTVTPVGGALVGSAADYMGIPTGIAGLSVNALPFRAMRLIWNEWFRDQNLQTSQTIGIGDGPDDWTNANVLLPRCKRPDYFTSALPWPQKGQDVTFDLAGEVPVHGQGGSTPVIFSSAGGTRTLFATGTDDSGYTGLGVSPTSVAQNMYWSGTSTGLVADMQYATSINVNDFREAFQLQRMFERDARGGTRYTEIIRAHFNVVSPDARLQRPEYLGGGSTMINVHPVAQTSPTGTYANTPQGNLAAFGTAGISGHGFSKSFTEHCIIIGFCNVRADITYQQGLNRMWSRRTRYDHYWPVLAHLGEQEILNKEVFAQGTAGATADEGVFGYQERYAEYRYKPSLITGKFRSTDTTSLDIWHLSQEFENLPTLSSQFIVDKPPIERIVAVADEPEFLMDCYFNLKCARPMPVYGVPGMVDHF